MTKVLAPEFFNRDTALVAKELLGKFLVRNIDGQEISAMILETEAYDGHDDLASHASRGKTGRNSVMFGQPGHLYVYLCYGVHEMLNVVTREKDYPAAVLIRAVLGYNGPGKLTKYLKINRSLQGKLAGKESGLWFEDRQVSVVTSNILAQSRIGVAYAGPVWSSKKLRFVLSENNNT
jgi:DNA-3-methyladenine glycosylase